MCNNNKSYLFEQDKQKTNSLNVLEEQDINSFIYEVETWKDTKKKTLFHSISININVKWSMSLIVVTTTNNGPYTHFT